MHAKHPLKTLAFVAAMAFAPVMASAHPGHDAGQDLAAGLMHPLTGLDHVLMIVAVSAWAALLKPAGRFVVAGCLALFVSVGALLPVAPAPGPALESAIAITVIGSGILLAVGRRWPLWATGSVAALFATIHGFAHGAEGPASSLAYVPGLALSTAALALVTAVVCARLVAYQGFLRAAGVLGSAVGTAALVHA